MPEEDAEPKKLGVLLSSSTPGKLMLPGPNYSAKTMPEEDAPGPKKYQFVDKYGIATWSSTPPGKLTFGPNYTAAKKLAEETGKPVTIKNGKAVVVKDDAPIATVANAAPKQGKKWNKYEQVTYKNGKAVLNYDAIAAMASGSSEKPDITGTTTTANAGAVPQQGKKNKEGQAKTKQEEDAGPKKYGVIDQYGLVTWTSTPPGSKKNSASVDREVPQIEVMAREGQQLEPDRIYAYAQSIQSRGELRHVGDCTLYSFHPADSTGTRYPFGYTWICCASQGCFFLCGTCFCCMNPICSWWFYKDSNWA